MIKSTSWKRGRKELDVNYGIVFSGLCSGYNRSQVARELNISNISSLNNKLILFRDVNKIKHIEFVIKELKSYVKELKAND